jgi:hypothetical protein
MVVIKRKVPNEEGVFHSMFERYLNGKNVSVHDFRSAQVYLAKTLQASPKDFQNKEIMTKTRKKKLMSKPWTWGNK